MIFYKLSQVEWISCGIKKSSLCNWMAHWIVSSDVSIEINRDFWYSYTAKRILFLLGRVISPNAGASNWIGHFIFFSKLLSFLVEQEETLNFFEIDITSFPDETYNTSRDLWYAGRS